MKSSKPIRRRFFLIPLFVSALCLAACGGGDAFDLAGTVERRTLELAAPISEVITELPVKEGDRVEAGEILVRLDIEVGEAELRAHQAARDAAEALRLEAARDFERQTKLRSSNVASQKAYDEAFRRRNEAVALVAEKDARIAQAEKRLEDLTVRAWAGGLVDQLPFAVGERAPAGGVVAVVLADEKPWVRVWMPARALASVDLGSQAEIVVEGLDGKLRGVVSYLAHEPSFTPHYALTERERAHLVYEARVTIEDAAENLRPGLPAQVRLAAN